LSRFSRSVARRTDLASYIEHAKQHARLRSRPVVVCQGPVGFLLYLRGDEPPEVPVLHTVYVDGAIYPPLGGVR